MQARRKKLYRAKVVTKPTPEEKKKIVARLKKKYPQMFDKKTARTKGVEKRLRGSLTEAEIRKLRGK